MDMQIESGQVTIAASQLDAETFEAARAAGLSVCTSANSTFNRQVARLATAIRAPLMARLDVLSASIKTMMAELDGLKLENAALRQARDACPSGYSQDVQRGLADPASIAARRQRLDASRHAEACRIETVQLVVGLLGSVTLKPVDISAALLAIAGSVNSQAGDDTISRLVELADETESGA